MTEATEILNFSQKLECIECQFLCCVPVKIIDWKNILVDIGWDQQYELARKTVSCDLLEKYNINISYQIAFLRYIIEEIESTYEEVHNEIYERYVDLKRKNLETVSFSFKHYKIPKENCLITLKESQSIIEQGTTGLCNWQAASALSEWAIRHPDRFQSKRILELGSGVGLTSFIISTLCSPSQMVLTDGNGLVLTRLKENFEINFAKVSNSITNIKLLDWNEIENSDIQKIIQPNLLIASDVVYDDTLFEPLCKTIEILFKNNENCSLILACTVRNEDTLNKFLNILDSKKFQRIEEKPVFPNHIYWDNSVPIKIFTITRLE